MIEAELKARVKDVEAVRTWLLAHAEEEEATYHDTYYDYPDRSLDAEGREIRLRRISNPSGLVEDLLTYKQPSIDSRNGSKPEHETMVTNAAAVELMLRDLGFIKLVTLSKQCNNFRFEFGGYSTLATLVRVPEIEGVFLEVEIVSRDEEYKDAIAVVRSILESLDLLDGIEGVAYTDAVRDARESNS